MVKPAEESQDEDPKEIDTPGWKTKLEAVLSRFKTVLTEDKPQYPPERAVEHHIKILEGASPPNRPAYRMSPAEAEDLKKQLTDLINRGMIRPSTSPYGAPVLFVKKPDSSNWF